MQFADCLSAILDKSRAYYQYHISYYRLRNSLSTDISCLICFLWFIYRYKIQILKWLQTETSIKIHKLGINPQFFNKFGDLFHRSLGCYFPEIYFTAPKMTPWRILIYHLVSWKELKIYHTLTNLLNWQHYRRLVNISLCGTSSESNMIVFNWSYWSYYLLKNWIIFITLKMQKFKRFF